MEFETRKRTTPIINLTALIDVVFILVIFVVLGANFHHIQTLDVSVPAVESTDEADTENLVITIPISGPIDIQGKSVELDEIRNVLQSMRQSFDSVLLVADRSAPVQRAVQALSDAQAVGFASVSIATQKPEEHEP